MPLARVPCVVALSSVFLAASTYNGQVQSGTIVTPNTQSLNGAFRTNPAAPITIDSASTVMVTGAAGQVTFSLATLMAAVAVAFFAARF